MKKILVFVMLIVNVMMSQGSGYFIEGFDSLKWGMSPYQTKILFASDSISQLSIEYHPELIIKIDGNLKEYAIQEIKAEFKSAHKPTFNCIFIDNKLCGIEIIRGIFTGKRFFYELQNRFNYLTEKGGLFNSGGDKYPYVEERWRKDGEIIIEYKNENIRLFQHEMKELYDILIQKIGEDRFAPIKG
ncbi:MAG: hypothetical protein WDA22_01635 [Bacteroidota bacterium]